jgi:hypothetical protein
MIKEIQKSKMTLLMTDYRNLKMQRRLPSITRKYKVKVGKPRLFPFSKAECDALLTPGDKNLWWYIKQIYAHEDERSERAYKQFQEEFKNRSTLVINGVSMYAKYINSSKGLRTMLLMDLVADFAEQKGLPSKELPTYVRVLGMLAEGRGKEGAMQFSKIASLLIGLEDIWVAIFKVFNAFSEEGYELQVDDTRYSKDTKIKQFLRLYLKNIYSSVENTLLGATMINNFKDPEKYSRLFINALFHLEKLEQLLDVPITDKLKSTRTSLVFIEMLDRERKSEYLRQFMQSKSALHASHY